MAGGVKTSPPPPHPHQNLFLRHRNSISSKLHHHSSPSDTSSTTTTTSSSSSASSSGEFDLITIKPVPYTSLRDILPSSTAVNSPKPKSPAQVNQPASQISIRNHLVKQAAWAYLQPMSTSPDSSARNFFHRLWAQFTNKSPVAAVFRFFDRHVIRRINRAFEWLLRIVRVRSSR